MRVLDLFSGIGGFSLGLERAGFQTVAFCEVAPYPRAVLARHWPSVPCYDDVRTLSATRLAADGIAVDAICGGFPCQDISVAGLGAGLSGARSGLWWEFHRLISEIRPRVVIAENVAALRSRGLDEVLRSLAAVGYDAEWHTIPASSVGAPHRRDRVWIIAHPDRNAESASSINDEASRLSTLSGQGSDWRAAQSRLGRVADGLSPVLDQHRFEAEAARINAWPTTWEAGVPRVCGKIPMRRQRLSALGNAVVPQIPDLIGRAIMAAL